MKTPTFHSPKSLIAPTILATCGFFTLTGAAAYWATQDDPAPATSEAQADGEGTLVVTEVIGDDDDDRIQTRAAVKTRQHFVQKGVQKGDGKARTIEITDDNGEVTVILNGEEVDSSRIKRDNGRIIILDENGKPIEDVMVYSFGADAFNGTLSVEGLGDIEIEELIGDQWQFRTNENNKRFPATFTESPRSMIGVYTDTPSDAICKHLKINPKHALIIQGIHDGLPAARAGLGEHDIIIKIDKSLPASKDMIHKVLAEKSPGDTVILEVIKSGEHEVVELELDAFDEKRMANATIHGKLRVQDMADPRANAFFAPRVKVRTQDGKADNDVFGYTFQMGDDKDMQVFVRPQTAIGQWRSDDGKMHSGNITMEVIQKQLDEALNDVRVNLPREIDVTLREQLTDAFAHVKDNNVLKLHDGNTFEQHMKNADDLHSHIQTLHERLDHMEALLKEIIHEMHDD